MGDPIEYLVKGYHLSLKERRSPVYHSDLRAGLIMQKIPLALLSAGTEATIEDVHATDALLRHLSAMGLFSGSRVTVVCADRVLILSVSGSRYALSRGMAMKILVRDPIQLTKHRRMHNGKDTPYCACRDPNVGKSTLFNAITGSHQHVGNWPGVTVEKKSGSFQHGDYDIEIIDLPGSDSLTAYSADEVIARDSLSMKNRMLSSTSWTQPTSNATSTPPSSLAISIPVVIAFNMSDMSETRGDPFDPKKMEEYLEIPVVRTVGSRGKGIPVCSMRQ